MTSGAVGDVHTLGNRKQSQQQQQSSCTSEYREQHIRYTPLRTMLPGWFYPYLCSPENTGSETEQCTEYVQLNEMIVNICSSERDISNTAEHQAEFCTDALYHKRGEEVGERETGICTRQRQRKVQQQSTLRQNTEYIASRGVATAVRREICHAALFAYTECPIRWILHCYDHCWSGMTVPHRTQ